MIWGALLAIVVGQPAAVTKPPVITYKDGVFTVADSTKREAVSTRIAKKNPPSEFATKVGDTWVVWDKRGLTVRVKNQARTWTFGDVPTSPKFFSQDEILNNLSRIESGEAGRSATSLSGWEQVGEFVYLQPRWVDRAGKSWIEALVRVDTSSRNPEQQVLSISDTPAWVSTPIDDRLHPTLNGFFTIADREGSWGVNYVPTGSKRFHFVPGGVNLLSMDVRENGRSGQFIERTSYGTYLAGLISIPEGARTNLAESRSPIEFTGIPSEVLRINGARETTIRNITSGLELALPKDVGVQTTGFGVLVWLPRQNPSASALYAVNSLRVIARWSGKPPARP